jgi:hypothetical protein
MEGAGGDGAGSELAEASPQLGGGAGREGQRHDAVRRVHARLDPVGDAVRDGAGLARAGAREDDDRAEERLRREPLLVVERLEERLGTGDGRLGGGGCLGGGRVGGGRGGSGGHDAGGRGTAAGSGAEVGDERTGHGRAVTTPARRRRGVPRTTPR